MRARRLSLRKSAPSKARPAARICRTNPFQTRRDETRAARLSRVQSPVLSAGGRIWTPPPSWEVLGSLSLRGTSGERAGERGTFHRIGAANWNPLSLPLSPLLRRGARESTSGMVVVPSCALGRKAALLILFDLLNHWFFGNQGLPMI